MEVEEEDLVFVLVSVIEGECEHAHN